MALKGNLKDFGITQLLNLINLARKTGTLYLEGAQSKAYLCFREGALVYAAADGQELALLPLLQKAGKLTAEQARVIATNMGSKPDRDVALMLIQSGHVQQQELVQLVRQHITDTAYSVFSWNAGTFRFEPNELPIQGKLVSSIALENVIMEGSRRLKEWERLQEEIPSLDVALKFAEKPNTPLRDVNLTVEEWRVISFVNPRNAIRQIAQYNNMSEFQIRKIVYGLLQAGLVEIIRPPRQMAEATVGEPRSVRPEEKERPEAMMGARRPDVKRSLIHKLIDRIREL
ncbi:MAG: DUF4388 domain-containing protein [Chloroflexi bacterium]|nr:DUF4388 domain-containing protein [Chloroflexota bacterium]HOC20190.1 DUF4388 domain-containing protein [Anaerolineae bacterium]HQM13545.1 DUF4388 domain-containing protein [Anaerolineae bacterium]